MTKLELIEMIQSLPYGDYELTEQSQPPPDRFDLPDTRTGAIYPPNPHIRIKYSERERRVFNISLMCGPR